MHQSIIKNVFLLEKEKATLHWIQMSRISDEELQKNNYFTQKKSSQPFSPAVLLLFLLFTAAEEFPHPISHLCLQNLRGRRQKNREGINKAEKSSLIKKICVL